MSTAWGGESGVSTVFFSSSFFFFDKGLPALLQSIFFFISVEVGVASRAGCS
jgi:hypothetical protein